REDVWLHLAELEEKPDRGVMMPANTILPPLFPHLRLIELFSPIAKDSVNSCLLVKRWMFLSSTVRASVFGRNCFLVHRSFGSKWWSRFFMQFAKHCDRAFRPRRARYHFLANNDFRID